MYIYAYTYTFIIQICLYAERMHDVLGSFCFGLCGWGATGCLMGVARDGLVVFSIHEVVLGIQLF